MADSERWIEEKQLPKPSRIAELECHNSDKKIPPCPVHSRGEER